MGTVSLGVQGPLVTQYLAVGPSSGPLGQPLGAAAGSLQQVSHYLATLYYFAWHVGQRHGQAYGSLCLCLTGNRHLTCPNLSPDMPRVC